jgi:hypothetical protein
VTCDFVRVTRKSHHRTPLKGVAEKPLTEVRGLSWFIYMVTMLTGYMVTRERLPERVYAYRREALVRLRTDKYAYARLRIRIFFENRGNDNDQTYYSYNVK